MQHRLEMAMSALVSSACHGRLNVLSGPFNAWIKYLVAHAKRLLLLLAEIGHS